MPSSTLLSPTGTIALGLITNGVGAFGEADTDISVSFNGHPSPVVSSSSNTAINYNRPYFDDISPRNVTSIVDETVVLKCRVKNKGDRTVSLLYCMPLLGWECVSPGRKRQTRNEIYRPTNALSY